MQRTSHSRVWTTILPSVVCAFLIGCGGPGEDSTDDDGGNGGTAGAGGSAGGGTAGKSSGGAGAAGMIGGTGGGSSGSSGGGGASGKGGSAGVSGASGAGGVSASGGMGGSSGGKGGVSGASGAGGAGGSSGGFGGAGGKGGGAAGSAQAGNGAAGTSSQAGSGGQPMTCDSVGSSMTVNATIRVGPGQTYDGECRRFIAAPNLGDGSQAEGQSPVFEIGDGGTLINVVLGAPAADGIHTEGDATLRNITWEDIGEDAMTVSGQGTVTLDGGSAVNGADKVFQVNAASTFRISNFTARQAGKFIRQNGGTTFTTNLFIDNCDISQMSESIARTDSSTSTVSMTNTRYSRIGDTNFIGFNGRITESNNTAY